MPRSSPLRNPAFRLFAIAMCLSGAALSPLTARAQDWMNWRGPNQNGDTQATGLPATFGPKDNVKWVVDMPGPSAGTPAILGDRVFVTAAARADAKLWAMCLDRKTGKTLWQREMGQAKPADGRTKRAEPSPVTDGKLVWFFFGTGDLAAFDLDGKEIWKRNIQADEGDFAFLWGFSTSPLVQEGAMYLQVLQRDKQVNGKGGKKGDAGPIESYILLIDPATGKTLAKHIRPSLARDESREAFSTPLPITLADGSKQIVIVGGDCITGHDPKTLDEIWRWGTWNPGKIGHWRLVPTPVYGEGVVLACGPKGAPIYAIKTGLKGDLSGKTDAVAWATIGGKDGLTSDVATPLFHDGKFYVVSTDGKKISCVDPKTGDRIWQGALPGKAPYRASPTAADGKIYVMDLSGEAAVVELNPKEFKLLHTVKMADDDDRREGDINATIAIAHNQLFIRTNAKLYCVGK